MRCGCMSGMRTPRRRLRQLRKPDEPGRVIAELSFGFWRFLLAKRYEAPLWIPTLRHGFPYLMGHGYRNDLHRQLMKLHNVRNRLAHHEPIHHHPLVELHNSLLAVAGWIDPTMRDWINEQSTVRSQLAECPPGVG